MNPNPFKTSTFTASRPVLEGRWTQSQFPQQMISDLLARGGTLIIVEQGPLWVRAVVGPRPLLAQDWYCGLLEFGSEPDANSLHNVGDSLWSPLWTALLQEALNIAGLATATSLTAPLNESSWFGYRVRLDEPTLEDSLNYPWEPRRYPGLMDSLNNCEFSLGERYRSVGSTGLGALVERVKPAYVESLSKGFIYQSLDDFKTEAQKLEALKTLWSLCHRAFQKAPYFAPITFGDFSTYYLGGIGRNNLKSLNTICLDAHHTIAGFLFGYLDDQELVLKSMAIDKPFQGQHLGDAILYPMASLGQGLGIDRFVSALVLQGNRSEFVFRKNTTVWEHQYAVLVGKPSDRH